MHLSTFTVELSLTQLIENRGGFFNPPYGCGSCWKTGNNPKDTSITCSCPDPRGDNPSIRVNLKVDLSKFSYKEYLLFDHVFTNSKLKMSLSSIATVP
jgi:hypothetical protein